MILLVGSSNDDILYFQSILKNKREVSILNQYTAYTGEILNQSIMLLKDVYTSYVSSLVISYIIEKYMAILVISVGEVQSFTESLKVGDICIAKQTVIGDVNISDVTNVAKGQLINLPQTFLPSTDITNSIGNVVEARTMGRAKYCTFVSTNYHPESVDQLATVVENNKYLGIEGNVVLSSEIGGIAIASKLHDIPYAAVSVVGRQIGVKNNIENYVNVLDQYANVGQAVVSVIGEIGRTDVVKQ